MHFSWAHNLQMIIKLCIRNAARIIIQSTEINLQYHSFLSGFLNHFFIQPQSIVVSQSKTHQL